MTRGAPSAGAVLNALSGPAPSLAGRAVFSLFCNPVRRGKVLPREQAVHEQARTEELTVGGQRVRVYRWGNGERPVLMLHGWQSRASRYAGFVPRLQELGLTPVSFDAPGHGESGGRGATILEYREIIRRLQDGHGAFHSVIAHSLGATSVLLALRSGTEAGRLVTVAAVKDFGHFPEKFADILGLRPGLRRDLRDRIEHQLFAEVSRPWELFDATRRPDEIKVPMRIIHDEDDEMVPVEQAYALKAAYGDRAELVITAGLGHRKVLGEAAVIDSAMDFVARPVPGE
ncbi:alpha/beta hydrolase [Streptomyces poriferorum]|uniref:Alpha/beta hydrolase n=1 Tax=Streptomyces poriferorum TaxID=2798799 RepID=A0ABY9IWK4_9ACTN|nr:MULTISPECIES: alpha/beta hydrolase [unclassified Streptomyces]MDP5312594.1 alpha/beta hydrolase [Streptomyces sp. Alt4]WLQ48946.1 alpha/beta hydrolase [Streptomyces sp. Alt1]WLQ58378.1 alpha/beta hydrolase [Streptomyces sp. Alt2]WSI63760.1 alpha/beta hydrolase [Streptomyces sp. NBC_01336]